MKKLLAAFLCLISGATFVFASCGTVDDALTVYAPDGAPALSIARLMNDESLLSGDVEYNVVNSSTIQTFVSGEEPKADICILPVNAASKLLGDGKTYKMLGTVTHGNLFLLKKEGGKDISVNNLGDLIGKTVGVINLSNVPGLTFKSILSDNKIEYAELGNDGEVNSQKVNLKALADGTEVLPSSDCDYFVVPEPAATTKINATQGKLSLAASIQTLYGGQSGYPQAVAVAKNSVIKSNPQFINSFINSFAENQSWLLNTDAQTIVSTVTAHLPEGTAPTFTSANLNATVIANCSVSFTSAQESKADVLAYIAKLNAISNNAWGTPADEFFYNA